MTFATIEHPTKQQLTDLLQRERGLCVSIMMRTHERGRESTQNPIRFKNLISQAIDRVKGEHEALRDRLKQIATLEHDFTFWQHQSAGFALFVCDGFEQGFKLSFTPDESVYVGEHFLVRPLAGACCAGGRTRALALSWERARMFECDGHEAHELSNDAFPTTMDALVTARDAEEQLQFSSHGPKGGGRQSATVMYHGHGEGEDKIEADREQYLQRVGKLLSESATNAEQPLVLVATQEVAGHFNAANPLDVAEVVQVSPDGIDDEALKSRIVEASRPLVQKSAADFSERVNTALANGAAGTELNDILFAAADGRIDTLLLGDREPRRGTFDRESRTVNEDNSADTDLVNVAVRETLQAGGTVYQHAPGEATHPLAAIYRY
ncbi:baeRF3 domain-containing protein [Roseimaritima ulvae]|uniref:Uncharacterized protein n=1 Tax=Roseimaritima ulvae TaxID=980254 RepID=A0A5B9R0B1_9BACT|nr:hypothetical protein [Roseimaritima ulvae]QEG43812.1 hypothetical protein UC8_58690 [Roseimaritima ulvae]